MSQKLGELVTLIRLSKNLSQEQLAQRVGINKSLISRYESGKRPLPIEKFMQICGSIDIPDKLIQLLVANGVSPRNEALAQEVGLLLLKEVDRGLHATKA